MARASEGAESDQEAYWKCAEYLHRNRDSGQVREGWDGEVPIKVMSSLHWHHPLQRWCSVGPPAIQMGAFEGGL